MTVVGVDVADDVNVVDCFGAVGEVASGSGSLVTMLMLLMMLLMMLLLLPCEGLWTDWRQARAVSRRRFSPASLSSSALQSSRRNWSLIPHK